jgi:hypothetical protein
MFDLIFINITPDTYLNWILRPMAKCHVRACVVGARMKVREPMEQCALKNVNNCLYTNIYSYLETSGGISYNPYLNVVHFFNTRVN